MAVPSMSEILAWCEKTFPKASVSIAPMQYTVVVLKFASGKVAFDRSEFRLNDCDWGKLRELIVTRCVEHLGMTVLHIGKGKPYEKRILVERPVFVSADEPFIISGD